MITVVCPECGKLGLCVDFIENGYVAMIRHSDDQHFLTMSQRMNVHGQVVCPEELMEE